VPEAAALQRLIAEKFTGRIAQVPPAASAVHIGGERAYRKMRQGRTVDLPPRDVVIDECMVLSYEHPDLTLRVRCGSGTYIRSLAHDLGAALRCGGYLSSLQRTRVGEWGIEHAIAPDKACWTAVLPLKEVLQSFPHLDLTDKEMQDIGHGKNIQRTLAQQSIAWYQDLPVAIVVPVDTEAVHARKVL
jgi:tRNA pseudouridine55 synthase